MAGSNLLREIWLNIGDHVMQNFQSTDSTPEVRYKNAAGIRIARGNSVSDGSPLTVVPGAWNPKKIDDNTFPDRPRHGSTIPATIANVRFMLEQNSVSARYNLIKKRSEIRIPGLVGTVDNADAVARAHIESLASSYGMPTSLVGSFTEAVADEKSYNPVLDWIDSAEWDGTDRLPSFYATIAVNDGYPNELKCALMHKWALSAVAAAAMPSGFMARGVLTLQGNQGIGKTSWVRSLVPDPVLRASVVKVDHHLDPSNKDSLISAVSHWLVEVGELDSSFKRDMARLKGFITADHDKVRRPYAKADSEYQRRTVFVATVNASDFLVDDTGNSRFWTIAVKAINYEHGIDMQQVFAQLAVEYRAGAIWHLSNDEDKRLEAINSQHRVTSTVRDRLLAIIDQEVSDRHKCEKYTPTNLLIAAGLQYPTNTQVRECAALLRELYGNHVRINGNNVWRVPIIKEPLEEKPSRPPVKGNFD